jgi:hypothetical protein
MDKKMLYVYTMEFYSAIKKNETYNCRYSGGKDQEDCSLKASPGNSTLSGKNHKNGLVSGARPRP